MKNPVQTHRIFFAKIVGICPLFAADHNVDSKCQFVGLYFQATKQNYEHCK